MKVEEMISFIGNTPLVLLNKIVHEKNIGSNIYAKLENMNVTGSVKDRPAYYMVMAAEKKGLLKRNSGYTIVIGTSGNTGIALSFLGATLGYNVIITMPESMSKERIAFMESYGAKIVLTPAKLGMKGSIEEAIKIANETPNSYLIDQFSDENNSRAHYETTAVEINNDIGVPNYIVAGFGTGGTISGIGKYFKEKNPDIKIIAVEPASSPLITEGKFGPHKIQGIGANFVPNILDKSVIDEFVTVENEEAIEMSKELATKEGIFVGISAGAALAAAIKLSERPETLGKSIVIILPDSKDRYLS